MKKEVIVCDLCEKIIKTPIMFDNKELCHYCNEKFQYEAREHIRQINNRFAETLKGCLKCKESGYIHKSIYVIGPGYFDEPDHHVYCNCKKGVAINPETDFIVT